MPKIAIFASGVGSNAVQLIKYFKKSANISVVLVVSNNKNAGVLQLAQKHFIESKVFLNEEFEKAFSLLDFLKAKGIDYIVLAGFLRKISPLLIEAFHDRIINIHPSLLPKFGGKGMYGRKVHEAVLQNKEQESGISIHLVNEEFDQGKILFQEKCKVGKDVPDLMRRVQELEHKHYAQVVNEYILRKQ